jgi:hypothetical protein
VAFEREGSPDMGAYEYDESLASGKINFNPAGSGRFNYDLSGSGKISR